MDAMVKFGEMPATAQIVIGVVVIAVAAIGGFVIWKAFPYERNISRFITEIRHEFKNNSGSTLRDQTDRIEEAMGEMRQTLTSHIVSSEIDRADLRKRIEAVPQHTADAIQEPQA